MQCVFWCQLTIWQSKEKSDKGIDIQFMSRHPNIWPSEQINKSNAEIKGHITYISNLDKAMVKGNGNNNKGHDTDKLIQ